MQQNALYAKTINWPAVRREALQPAARAQTHGRYYPGIDYALSQRNEHHSFLRLPDNLSDADKQRSWTAMKKILGPSFALAPQRPASLFRIRSEISGHLVPSGKLSFA